MLDLRLYGEITGVYDSGLTPAAQSGNSLADYGIESGAGVIGSRRWRHDKLTLEYRGRFRHYARESLFNGSDQYLNLDYSRALQRGLTMNIKQIAGTTTLANGEFSYLSLTNTDLFALPANELFDDRTNYAQSRVTLIWQNAPRLSFDFSGEGFLVRRHSFALAGLNGYSARAGLAYRLTRRQTIGATYQHTYFTFQRTFGSARVETAAIEYSVALSRSLDFALQLGGSHLETGGLTQVSIDPAIAAIIGQNVANVTFFRVLYVPLAEARLIRRFSRSSVTLGYSSGFTPGNGVYLTSRQTAATAGFSYSSPHRLTAGLNVTYNQLSSLGQSLPKYSNLAGGAGLTYRLAGDTHLELRYDYRHFTTQNLIYQKDSNRISLGLAFSPGASPLAIW